MRDRINNPKNPRYHKYGGRGITYHKDFEDLETFAVYVESLPGCGELGLSIDRINNDEGYTYDNLRWADACTQANNRSQAVGSRGALTIDRSAFEIRVGQLKAAGWTQTSTGRHLRFVEGFSFSQAVMKDTFARV